MPWPAPRSLADLLAHPGFPDARLLHCQEHLALFADIHFNRTYMAMGRNVLFSAFMCLSAGYRADDRATWPTVGRLLEISDAIGLGSRRMAEGFVARLKQIGFIEEVTAPDDRRIKLLRPTESMLEHDRRYSAALFNGLLALPPCPHYTRQMGLDPAFNLAQRRAGLASMSEAPRIIGRHSWVFRLFNRDAAYGLVCWAIVSAARDGAPRLDLSELGRHFGVSRTHVRDLIDEFAKAGFVAVTGSGQDRRLEVREGLYEFFDPRLADVLAAQERLAYMASTGSFNLRH